MKIGLLYPVLVSSLLLGCAGPRAKSEIEANQRLARENEQRLATLENSVTALNSQIAALNNRVYEVRTKTGQKTSMIVAPAGGAPAPAPVQRSAAPAPAGKKITPTPPAPAAKPAPKAAPRPEPASASGSLGAPSPAAPAAADDLALPPAELPSEHSAAQAAPAGAGAPAAAGPKEASSARAPARNEAGDASVPVPRGNTSYSAPADSTVRPLPGPYEYPPESAPPVPVPLSPTSDLSLPSEHPAAEGAAAQAPTAAAPRAEAAAPVQAAAKRPAQQSEQAAYNAALSAARSGRTSEGIRLFRQFLQKYPSGPYAANAEYWIGECLYSQGKYNEALSEFQNVNNFFPSHHKNADALLKAGITLNKMGNKEGAAEKFNTLIARFPNSDAARRAKAMGVK